MAGKPAPVKTVVGDEESYCRMLRGAAVRQAMKVADSKTPGIVPVHLLVQTNNGEWRHHTHSHANDTHNLTRVGNTLLGSGAYKQYILVFPIYGPVFAHELKPEIPPFDPTKSTRPPLKPLPARKPKPAPAAPEPAKPVEPAATPPNKFAPWRK